MNQTEIANLAASVGFPDPQLASAVAMAESGGNPRAFNGRGADESYGLWQINMIGSLGPQRRAAFGLSSNSDLYDPAVNARAALAISSGGTNWRPWGAYTNGSYKRFMGGASAGSGGSTNPVQPGQFGLPSIQTPFGRVSLTLVGAALLVYLILK